MCFGECVCVCGVCASISLILEQRGLQCSTLSLLQEELQVVLGELHQLPQGPRLRPWGVAAHILLKVQRLHHLGQGHLPRVTKLL